MGRLRLICFVGLTLSGAMVHAQDSRCISLFEPLESGVLDALAAIEVEGPSPWNQHALFRAYFAQRSFEEALRVAEQTLAQSPGDRIAQLQKEQALEALEQ